MPRFLVALLLLIVPSWAWADVRVVTTVPELAAIANQVLGEHGQATAMTLPTQDPHWVDAKPSLALDLSRADVLLLVGLELETGWLPNLLVASRNPRVQQGAPGFVDCSQFVGVLEVPVGQVSRAQGDLHPGGNPHYFYDPRNAAPLARGIAARLGKVDPANAGAYASNAEGFAKRAEEAISVWTTRLQGLRGQSVLEYHRSFIYVAQWLGLVVAADLEPKPGIPPSPAHVAQVLRTAEAQGTKVILQESYHPTQMSKLVAEKAGARLVLLPSGPDLAAGQDWFAHKEAWVRALLGGS